MGRARPSTKSSSGRRKPSNGGSPLPSERVSLASLTPHPRNYRAHPDDQLDHIARSLEEHGLYRNVVVARDGTILAGHGVVEAARRLGWEEIAVVRVDLDPDEPRAIKILTGDNELGRLAEVDDRLLADHLKLLSEAGELQGTGYDEAMLANLVYVTRPSAEVADLSAAEQWVGMPEFDQAEDVFRLALSFESEEQRAEVLKRLGIESTYVTRKGHLIAAWWPPRPREDRVNVRYVSEE